MNPKPLSRITRATVPVIVASVYVACVCAHDAVPALSVLYSLHHTRRLASLRPLPIRPPLPDDRRRRHHRRGFHQHSVKPAAGSVYLIVVLARREPTQLADVCFVPVATQEIDVASLTLRAERTDARFLVPTDLHASVVHAREGLRPRGDDSNACAAAFLLFALCAPATVHVRRLLDDGVYDARPPLSPRHLLNEEQPARLGDLHAARPVTAAGRRGRIPPAYTPRDGGHGVDEPEPFSFEQATALRGRALLVERRPVILAHAGAAPVQFRERILRRPQGVTDLTIRVGDFRDGRQRENLPLIGIRVLRGELQQPPRQVVFVPSRAAQNDSPVATELPGGECRLVPLPDTVSVDRALGLSSVLDGVVEDADVCCLASDGTVDAGGHVRAPATNDVELPLCALLHVTGFPEPRARKQRGVFRGAHDLLHVAAHVLRQGHVVGAGDDAHVRALAERGGGEPTAHLLALAVLRGLEDHEPATLAGKHAV